MKSLLARGFWRRWDLKVIR
uniref:Uncharacterized protein n=1 Tax=Rhizophora mucronata TaxID=61149 RepID=A0A2P2MTX9_RHIMU